MQYPGLWYVEIPVPEDTRSPADVDILQIGEMSFVKIPDFFKKRFPVDRRSRTGREYFVLFFLICGGLIFSSRKSPAEGAVKIARVVQLQRILKLNQLGLG